MDDQELITAIENVQKGIDVEENFRFVYYRSYHFVENKIRQWFQERKRASYDVEDVAQDVYIYMSMHLSALKEPKAFWGWTDEIVKGKINDHFDSKLGKTIAKENALEIKPDEDDDNDKTVAHDIVDEKVSNNPEQQAMQNATVAAVHEILDDLTDAQREVIIPFFLYGKKEREIAEELDLNLNTVKSRLKSGKDAIYKRKADLRKRGIEIAVIPFVLLLHIASHSDEALAASLSLGTAAAGIAGARASAEAATSASKAAAGTGEAAKAAGTAAGGAKTAGAAGEAAKAAGVSGTAKAAGAGIAVKAAAAVAAVAVVAGGAFVYSSSNKPTESVVETTIATTDTSVESTTSQETTTIKEVNSPGVYATAYGPAVEEYAATYGISTDDVVILLEDLDDNGTIEMDVFTKSSPDQDTPTNDSLYTISDDGAAVLLIHGSMVEEFYGKNGEVCVWVCDEVNQTQDLYTMDGSSLNLIMSAPYTVTGTDDISAAEDEMNDILFNITDYATVVMTKITYDQLISISDDHLMEMCKDSVTE